jgi:long-chain acyl-CoA synthetase
VNLYDPAQRLNPDRWLFDLDGCLVDSFGGTFLRPLARELLTAVVSTTGQAEIWSAGGAEYAERVANRVGIADLVSAYWEKDRGSDGKWAIPFDHSGYKIVCVDDQPDGVPAVAERIVVFPYLGQNDHDRALQRVIERVKT